MIPRLRFLFLLFFSCWVLLLPAQSTWRRMYYNTGIVVVEAFDMKALSDGNYILTGRSADNYPQYSDDLLLLKISPQGDTLWAKNIRCPYNAQEIGWSIDETQNHDLVVTGDYNDSNSVHSIFVMRTDASGNLLWTKAYSLGANIHYGVLIEEAPNGDLLVAGDKFGAGVSGLLLRLSASGTMRWARNYNYNYNFWEQAMVVLPDNSIVISGQIDSLSSAGFTGGMFMMRVDSAGQLLYTNFYYQVALDPYSMTRLHSGEWLIGGGLNDSNGRSYGMLTKLDANGELLWTKGYPTYSNCINHIVELPQNKLLLACGWNYAPDTGSVIITDTAGNWLQHIKLPGTSMRRAFPQAGKGFIAEGVRYSPANTVGVYTVGLDSMLNGGCDTLHRLDTMRVFQLAKLSVNAPTGSDAFQVTSLPFGVHHLLHVDSICGLLAVPSVAATPLQCTVQPQPFHDRTNLVFSRTLVQAQLQLFDVSGRIIASRENINGNQYELQAPFGAGIYFFSVTDRNGLFFRGKLVIQ